MTLKNFGKLTFLLKFLVSHAFGSTHYIGDLFAKMVPDEVRQADYQLLAPADLTSRVHQLTVSPLHNQAPHPIRVGFKIGWSLPKMIGIVIAACIPLVAFVIERRTAAEVEPLINAARQ